MNQLELIICNSVTIIVFGLVVIKLKCDLSKLNKLYSRLLASEKHKTIELYEEKAAMYYNQKCHLENLLQEQSKLIEKYQQVLK